jgi:hypothetical protein
MDRTYEYIYLTVRAGLFRLKFITDEKHLKGRELYNKKVRRCPSYGKS